MQIEVEVVDLQQWEAVVVQTTTTTTTTILFHLRLLLQPTVILASINPVTNVLFLVFEGVVPNQGQLQLQLVLVPLPKLAKYQES